MARPGQPGWAGGAGEGDSLEGSPRYRCEGQLLAVSGEALIGFAAVNLFPENQDACNATTGVIREYRGRKIALALKVLAARYARQHGARTVRTDNDSRNAPILAINRRMGYQPQPGTYQLVCWLEGTEQKYPPFSFLRERGAGALITFLCIRREKKLTDPR